MTGEDVGVPGTLLLSLAWVAIGMWRSVKPPRPLFVVALVPALVATALVVWFSTRRPSESDLIATMFACVAAVVVPFAIMMRHQVVRLIKFVFPSARLVQRRTRRG